MDRIAILEDAIEYIMELQRQETELQEEVKTFEVEDCGKSTLQIRVQKDRELAEGTRNLPLTDLNKSLSDSTKKTQMEVHKMCIITVSLCFYYLMDHETEFYCFFSWKPNISFNIFLVASRSESYRRKRFLD